MRLMCGGVASAERQASKVCERWTFQSWRPAPKSFWGWNLGLPCPEGFRGWILALVLPVHSPHPPTKFVTFFCPLRSNGCKPMKTFIRNLFLVPALIAGFGLIPAGLVTAQTF